MTNRVSPDPADVAHLLEPIRRHALDVARAEAVLSAHRRARNAAIRAALAAECPPTHAQLAEAAGLQRGQIPSIAAGA